MAVVAPPDPGGAERYVAVLPCPTQKTGLAEAKMAKAEPDNQIAGTQIHLQAKNPSGGWRTLVEYDYLGSSWRESFR